LSDTVVLQEPNQSEPLVCRFIRPNEDPQVPGSPVA